MLKYLEGHIYFREAMPCDNITGKGKRKHCAGDIVCCLYCEFISECYKKRKRGNHYCRIEKTLRYCSFVEKKLDREGLKPDWRIA